MKYDYVKLFILIIPILLLNGCNTNFKIPLINEKFDLVSVYEDETLIYETNDSKKIEEIIHKINTSRRDSTHTWQIPESTGKIIFLNEDKEEELVLNLHNGGDVTCKGYYIYSGLSF
ncbi:hypothetical protein [Bacillus sp. AK128]